MLASFRTPRRTVPLVGALAAATAVASGVAAQPRGAVAAADPYAAAVSAPVEDPYYPAKGDPSVDALHYGLRLSWAPRSRVLTGVARIRFRSPVAQSSIQLDLGDPLTVRGVRLDGAAVPFRHPGKDLVVETGALAADSRHTLVVRYRGAPKPVLLPTTRSDSSHGGWTTTKRGEVWTMQEPFGAFTWYPVNDHPSDKAFYDARISVPRRMVGIFNGRLASRKVASGRTVTRWHLASPAAAYLTTIAIGDYVRYRDKGPRGLPLTYWVLRRDRSALPSLRRSPALLRWLEGRLGRYPFDRLGVVMVPGTSAMETQTLVTMGRQLAADPQLMRSVLVHEYAHQWYGDLVTPRTWPDLWLNESFAMYTEFQWEVSRGWFTQAQLRRYLAEQDAELRAKDGPPGAYKPGRFAEDCVYYCGALMVERLSQRLGADLFAQVWREWPRTHQYGNASREDYIAWVSARTGQDLGPFLTEWLTSPTTPAT